MAKLGEKLVFFAKIGEKVKKGVKIWVLILIFWVFF